jgi:hypothetical protein
MCEHRSCVMGLSTCVAPVLNDGET